MEMFVNIMWSMILNVIYLFCNVNPNVCFLCVVLALLWFKHVVARTRWKNVDEGWKKRRVIGTQKRKKDTKERIPKCVLCVLFPALLWFKHVVARTRGKERWWRAKEVEEGIICRYTKEEKEKPKREKEGCWWWHG